MDLSLDIIVQQPRAVQEECTFEPDDCVYDDVYDLEGVVVELPLASDTNHRGMVGVAYDGDSANLRLRKRDHLELKVPAEGRARETGGLRVPPPRPPAKPQQPATLARGERPSAAPRGQALQPGRPLDPASGEEAAPVAKKREMLDGFFV
jgi:hypothetical protein